VEVEDREMRVTDALPRLEAFSLFVSMLARLQSALFIFLPRHMQIVFVFQAHISACARAKREREMRLDLYSRSRAPTIVWLLMRFLEFTHNTTQQGNSSQTGVGIADAFSDIC
jgi:hypothetical protein